MIESTHRKLIGTESRLFKQLNKRPSQSPNSQSEHEKPEGDLKIRLVIENKIDPEIINRIREFLKRFEPKDPVRGDDFEIVENVIDQVCKEQGIKVLGSSERTRIITIEAPVEIIERFFNVNLALYDYEVSIKNSTHSKVVMGHEGHVFIPHMLHGIVHSVIGLRHHPLDPQAITMAQIAKDDAISAAYGKTSKWMAEFYEFPHGTTGKGQHIGIIACGGGFEDDEYTKFFERVGLENIPKITTVDIDGVGNNPGQNWLYDYELATDTLVAGCAAPGIDITIYFCDGKMDSFMDTIEHIIDQKDKPSIISYSWGGDEEDCLDLIEGVNRVLEVATIDHDITIFCSAGDFGSTNNKTYPKERDELSIQFPASSPWVTSCGGTMFKTSGMNAAIEEVVWNSVFLYGVLIKNATGGGFSSYIDRPDYQKSVVPDLTPAGYINPDWFKEGTSEKEKKEQMIAKFKSQRGIPDVAGHASLAPNGFGYWVNFQNEDWLTGGTSAVAPLWAALTARLNEALGENIGFFNEKLYKMAGSDAFKPVLNGHNGLIETCCHWVAGEPWNPCTGLGIPNGENLLKKLKTMKSK